VTGLQHPLVADQSVRHLVAFLEAFLVAARLLGQRENRRIGGLPLLDVVGCPVEEV
jgi:hypothetical protein